MKIDFSNSLAADMDAAMTENKDMFSQAAVLEKLAFTRVADEDKVVSEIEIELQADLDKAEAETKSALTKKASAPSLMDSVNALLKVSEDLDNAGFEKFAAASILLATRLVSVAKGKSESKTEKAKSKEKSKDKSKSSKKPMSKSERMKKLRDMKKGKGKKVSKAQEQRPTEVVMHDNPAPVANPATPGPAALQPEKSAPAKPTEPSKLAATLKQKFQAVQPDTFAALQWQQFTVSPSATTPGTFDVVAKIAATPKGATHMAQVAKSAPGGSVSNMVKSVLEGMLPKGSKVSVMTVPYSTGGAK